MTADRDGWSFAGAREPAAFAAAVQRPGPGAEHAWDGQRTLCGLAADKIEVYRHLFIVERARVCPVCRDEAAAAPTRPSVQERLHDRLQEADESPMREEIREALRHGATVKIWFNGPAADMAKFYAELDQIVEGATAVTETLEAGGWVGLARVEHTPWEFVIVLPDDAPPAIARTPAKT